MNVLNKNTDLGILILRLSIGIMMLLHGVSKMFNGIEFIEQVVIDAGLPHFFAYGVYIGEFIVPILIILGVATRISSLILVINCTVAMLLVHSAEVFTINDAGGWGIELLGLYLFGALALVFTGGGKYAISKRFIWD